MMALISDTAVVLFLVLAVAGFVAALFRWQ